MELLKKLLLNKYTFLILVFVLGIGIGCSKRDKPSTITPTKPEKEIVYVDSIVYVPKPYPVYIEKKVEVPVPYYVEVDKENETIVRRRYRDVVQMDDSLSVSYDAYVTGSLDSLSLGVKDTRPEKIIYRTKEIQVKSSQRGIYVGGSVGPRSLAPSVVYQSEKNLFGVGYDIVNQNAQISYHRKLF